MTIDRTGRGHLLGHDEQEYRVWPSGGPPSAGRAFPNTPQGWQEAWREFEFLEGNMEPAPPPPVRTSRPGRSRRRFVLPVAVLSATIALIAGIALLGGNGETAGGGDVLLTEDFTVPVSGSEDFTEVSYVDGALHVTVAGTEQETEIALAACQSPLIGRCDAGSAALRVGADVQLVARTADADAGAGIGCENRESQIGYAFVLATTNPPQFEVFGNDGILATAVAPADLRTDASHRFLARCLSGARGAGITLVLRVDGVQVIRLVDSSRDYTFFTAIDFVVLGPGTVGVFDNAMIQED